jgi:predicted nucleic acid-binding protein
VTNTSAATISSLVLDATCLSHFARADRLDVLQDLLFVKQCWTTETVLAELNRGIADYPLLRSVSEQEWLLVAGLDSVTEIRLYGRWLRRVGSAGRDRGEASVFAAAERYGATAITDDRKGRPGWAVLRFGCSWHYLAARSRVQGRKDHIHGSGQPDRRLARNRPSIALHGRGVRWLRTPTWTSIGVSPPRNTAPSNKCTAQY